MRRRLLNALVFASAGLSALAGAMYLRSVFRFDRFYVGVGQTQWMIESGGGWLLIQQFDGWPEQPVWRYQAFRGLPIEVMPPVISYSAGFSWSRGPLLHIAGTAFARITPAGSLIWGPAIPPKALPQERSSYSRFSYSNVGMKYWAIILLAALPLIGRSAVLIKRRLVARSRRSRGLCADCGYDLRASGPPCPECGAVGAPGAGAAA